MLVSVFDIETAISEVCLKRLNQRTVTDYFAVVQRDIPREVPSSRQSLQELQENVALRTTTSPADTCYVCNLECSGAHKCLQCGNNVHAICGNADGSDDEGYGRPVVYKKCSL